MKCPYCNYFESKVIDSRPTDENAKIRRRRECISCAKRFTTYEMVEVVPLVIIKKDGTRELFDRSKLLNGLLRACYKRPVTYETLEQAVFDVETMLNNSTDNEVPSTIIGELIMQKLKDIDEVAYIRFASVYKQFDDINTFMSELKSFIKNK